MKADVPDQPLSTPCATWDSPQLSNSASLTPSSRACANQRGRASLPAPVLGARSRQPLSHLGAGPWLRA